MENTKLTNSVTTPQTFRVEVEAVVLFDVEATSKDDALRILEEKGFKTNFKHLHHNRDEISWSNVHYEACDFNRAIVTDEMGNEV
jgi:hypothetical protein